VSAPVLDLGGSEQDVTALDVGRDLFETIGFEGGLERGHLDQVLATDVDPA